MSAIDTNFASARKQTSPVTTLEVAVAPSDILGASPKRTFELWPETALCEISFA
jgi:hypothetical protein